MEYGRRDRRGGYGGYGRREGRGFGPRFPPKPVEIGKEYDVEIRETSRRGEGIARIKGLVVFVPNTKPGDKVRIRVTRISRRFCEAEVVGKGEAPTEGEAEEVPTEEVPTEEVPTEEVSAEEAQTEEAAAEEATSDEASTQEATSSEEAQTETETDTETM